MESMVFDEWIELGHGSSGILKIVSRTGKEHMVMVLMLKGEGFRAVQLTQDGETVSSSNGTTIQYKNRHTSSKEARLSETRDFINSFTA